MEVEGFFSFLSFGVHVPSFRPGLYQGVCHVEGPDPCQTSVFEDTSEAWRTEEGNGDSPEETFVMDAGCFDPFEFGEGAGWVACFLHFGGGDEPKSGEVNSGVRQRFVHDEV